jgi:hypothetical protein
VSPAARRALARFALLMTVAVLASRLWFVFHRAIDVDEFEHAHATWCVSRGLVLYADFFEHHTPWLYLLFAPLFTRVAIDTDPVAAVSLLVDCRLVMWAMTAGTVALVYDLGALWRDRFVGALAAALLVTASAFLDSMLEFRPDVPALLCVLASMALAIRAWRADRVETAATRFALSGLSYGAALMFTQKSLFAVPGLGLALLVYLVDGRTILGLRTRAALVALFTVALLAPIALTAWWFLTRHALGAFVHYNVTFNVGQVASARFSPFPRLLSNVLRMPALFGLGFAGFGAAVGRVLRRLREDDLVLVLTAASLFVGLFVVGRAYDQYYVMFLPQLAIFGASFAAEALPAVEAQLRVRNPLRAAQWALVGVLALGMGELGRTYGPMAPQILDLTYVLRNTRPSDTVFSGATGAGVFRPHAWFYFFMSGPFATEREYAELAEGFESGRIRPQIVVLDEFARARMPPAVIDYVLRHYRPVRAEMFERLPD